MLGLKLTHDSERGYWSPFSDMDSTTNQSENWMKFAQSPICILTDQFVISDNHWSHSNVEMSKLQQNWMFLQLL